VVYRMRGGSLICRVPLFTGLASAMSEKKNNGAFLCVVALLSSNQSLMLVFHPQMMAKAVRVCPKTR
jgi:hypothetical protein